MKSKIRIIIAIALVGLMAGCASQPQQPKPAPTAEDIQGNSLKLNQWLSHQNLDIPAAVYRVAPPDKIRVVAPGAKEIDGQETGVRPDGKMMLNLIGEIKAGGLTPAEISEEIAQKLSAYYRADTIDVSVQVLEFNSQHFYVFGQVMQPGIKPYTGRDTVLRALADAKLNEKAWPQRIIIVRPNEDVNIHQRVTLDVKAMYEDGSVKENYLLESGDVVFVPPSPLAKFSEEAMKIITPIIPATQLGMIARGGI